jgi:hypothetical protein
MSVKLYVGYIGVDRIGRRVHITKATNNTSYPFRAENGNSFTKEGKYYAGGDMSQDIIGPWVEYGPKPTMFKDLTDEEKGEILLAFYAGKEMQYFSVNSRTWIKCISEKPLPLSIYRIKPAPREYWISTGKQSGVTQVHNEAVDGAVHVREVME